MTLSSDPDNTQKTSILRLLATYLVIILVSLACVEGAVRLRQWWLYGSANTLENSYRLDEKIGLRIPIAGYETRTTKINSLGFRGPEITLPKPKGTLRIAFIGGSTTYCAEASGNDKVWPHLVWQKIQSHYPNIPMDYVNAGIPGSTVPSSLKDLRLRVRPLQPDIFIIYHASNDMTLETRKLAQDQGLLGKPDATTLPGQYSLFWFLVEKNLQLWNVQKRAQAGIDRLHHLPSTFGDEFEKNLTELTLEAKSQGGFVALATLSQQLREDHDEGRNLNAASSSLYYMPYMTPKLLLKGFRSYNKTITKTAHATGSLLIANEDSIPGDPLHFNDSIHFTDAGNGVMSERVSHALLSSADFQEFLKKNAANP